MVPSLQRFLYRTGGAATLEFVAIFLALIATIFFVVEITLYLFFSATLEKAAEAGVRLAVVSPPVVSSLPTTIQRTTGGVFGVSCSDASAPCVSFATASCTGTACDATPFDRILKQMQGFNAQIKPENVTISYEDTGLGFAGGPIVPLVTVSIANVPFQTGIIGLLVSNAGVISTLPARSASMTGEDLN